MRELIESPLDQAFTQNDKSVLIEIYRKPDTDWTVQVSDIFGYTTVWRQRFATDTDALNFVISELKRDGIEEFIGPPSDGLSTQMS
jgi:hypothetical protein